MWRLTRNRAFLRGSAAVLCAVCLDAGLPIIAVPVFGVSTGSGDTSACATLPPADQRVQIPGTVLLGPGESVTFEPTALPPSAAPSSFSPVYVCVENDSAQPVAVQDDFTGLWVVAPVEYIPQVIASLAPAGQVESVFRGCAAPGDEPNAVACAAGGRILGGRSTLTLAVTLIANDAAPVTAQQSAPPQ
jgi:hypothetical protein